MNRKWIWAAGGAAVAITTLVIVLVATRKRTPSSEPTREPDRRVPPTWTVAIPASALPETKEALAKFTASDSAGRYEILARLHASVDPALVAPMRAVVSRGADENVVVRVMAARILASYGDASGRAALIEGLRLEHPYFRSGALVDLARLDGEKARPYAEAALSDASPDVRARAARILLGFGDRSCYARFAREAQDSGLPKASRRAAAIALGLLDPADESYAAFLALLRDPDPDLLVLAAERIVVYGNRDCLPSLRALLNHPKSLVRDTARAAVEQVEK